MPGKRIVKGETSARIKFAISELSNSSIPHGELEIRAESWERTAEYLRSGYVDGDYVVEECSKPEEADAIAAHYRSIISKIETQREEQS